MDKTIRDTPEQAYYWLDEEIWLKYFTKEEILAGLAKTGYQVEDLTTTEKFTHEPYQTKRKLIKDWHTSQIRISGTIRHKEYGNVQAEGYATTTVRIWRIPAKYQGLQHGKLILAILNLKFKWFKKFKWNAYELHNYRDGTDEIYLQIGKDNTGFNSVYVPYTAFKDFDKQKVIDRCTSYWKSYYNTPDRKKDQDKQLRLLKHPTTLSFFKYLDKEKKARDKKFVKETVDRIAKEQEWPTQ